MRTSLIHSWRWDPERAGFVPPTSDLVMVRAPRGEDPYLLIAHAATIAGPEDVELLAGSIQQAADIIRSMTDPARELPALRARVAELEGA